MSDTSVRAIPNTRTFFPIAAQFTKGKHFRGCKSSVRTENANNGITPFLQLSVGLNPFSSYKLKRFFQTNLGFFFKLLFINIHNYELKQYISSPYIMYNIRWLVNVLISCGDGLWLFDKRTRYSSTWCAKAIRL